ncbi:MAG: peptide chain release factor N(5)-glutamine methyltransferase [Paludisphaera borealis]|uniref:peptide chain release factor N(5)-glutamine methyltransferase n=1 Tax=Paludisphaera borealis TaxID=1387353 RepID=UPI002843AF7B|nr:peptide chain release factor N(5)-glutamine methyltransferase [Paludisphaera borealis]MDR3618820.1 peptide chain release factor N(5)-glutamine methyltransferase [Paludisphaera borealis]
MGDAHVGTPSTPAGAAVGAAEKSEDSWSVGRLLTWTTDYLRRRGSESPRLDAEVMLASVLEWERVQLYTHFEDVVGERARDRYRELVKRRAEGAPVAYLVGRKEFYSLRFDVAPGVLIPRPETEFVVVEFLEVAKARESVRAVDVGTGSGCLAVACAYHHPTAEFVAVDLSPDALDQARKNAARHDLTGRIEFLEGDLLAPVAGRPAFDVIVSNPPYIPTREIETLEAGVRDHEPLLALDGGPDGLAVVTRLIADAVPLLKSGGHLILEIGSPQEADVRDRIAAHPEYTLLPTVRDLRGHPRVIHAVRN